MKDLNRWGFLFGFGVLVCQDADAQTWSFSAQPTVAIGEVEGEPEYLLNRVAHVRRMRDGRILVTMGPDIRFYDARGKYVSKAGGRGRGPGEFQYIQDLLVLPGDTLLALNFGKKVWLNAEGKYIREETMNLSPLSGGGWFSEGATLLPNGNLLAMQYEQEKPNDPRMKQLHRPVMRYTILDVNRTVAGAAEPAVAGNVHPLVVSGGLRQMKLDDRESVVQPFTPHAQHAVGQDRVYVGDNDTTHLSVFALDGKPLGTIRVAERATPVTAADLEFYRNQTLQFYATRPEAKPEFERGWAAVPKPKRHPYFGSALVDRTGNLWVSEPIRDPRASSNWSVFDRTGKSVAKVLMPAGFRPKEIGADYVLGVTRDALDVEQVRMYSLIKR